MPSSLRSDPRPRGLTLIECLLALSILSGGVLVASYTVVAAQKHERERESARVAVRLAEDLLEEIVSKSFADPEMPENFGPEADETARSLFDDCDDYDGYSEASGTLADFSGTKYGAAAQSLARSVAVRPATHVSSALETTFNGIQVTVTVTGAGRAWQAERFIPQPAEE